MEILPERSDFRQGWEKLNKISSSWADSYQKELRFLTDVALWALKTDRWDSAALQVITSHMFMININMWQWRHHTADHLSSRWTFWCDVAEADRRQQQSDSRTYCEGDHGVWRRPGRRRRAVSLLHLHGQLNVGFSWCTCWGFKTIQSLP